jgi:lantibiotic modifying enzyme
MTTKAFFDNRYADFSEEKRNQYMDRNGRFVNAKTRKWIKHQLDTHLQNLDAWLERCNQPTTVDYTVYSGCAGFALLYLNICNSPICYSRLLLQKSMSVLEAQVAALSGQNFSFLTGDCGPLAVASVLYMRHGERTKAIKYMEQMKQYASLVCDTSKGELTDDLCTGRAGYLFSLLFVYTNVEWQPVITTDLIRKVLEAIVRSGQDRANRTVGMNSAGLCFSSNDSPTDPFIGALYGQAGVLHTLLIACKSCAFEDLDQILKTALLFLLNKHPNSKFYPLTLGVAVPPTPTLQVPHSNASLTSGVTPNIPPDSTVNTPKSSSLSTSNKPLVPTGNVSPQVQAPPTPVGPPISTDDLTQWCHGASGLCMLFCTASVYFKYDRGTSETFLKEATICGELIWERGLSVKGYGLCHGAAGSAYAMLRLYQVTRKDVYLHRSFQFAEHCADYTKHNLKKVIDYTSLFEGKTANQSIIPWYDSEYVFHSQA